jgi:hypothetical protein
MRPEVAFQTNLEVKYQTTANTSAWVKATTVLDPFGGRERTIPGVSTKKRMNA